MNDKMTDLEEFAHKNLNLIREANQYRSLQKISRSGDSMLELQEKKLISFSCNDYLGLSLHPEVLAAATLAIKQYGVGAAASRMVTGNHPLYSQLEEQLAKLHHTEAALVFGSGYLANLGTITALTSDGDLILADKLVHASIIDGAKLSGAKVIRFKHNDLTHAAQILKTQRHNFRNCLIITEGVFSMDGDRAPLTELSLIAKQYKAWLLSDNAHLLDFSKQDIDLHIGSLSKYIGSYGGYVCGAKIVIDYIQNRARSFIFSTALPAAIIGAGIASLEIIAKNPTMLGVPLKHAEFFCRELGLPPSTSQIVPLIIGEEAKTLQFSSKLMEAGFQVIAIRPPTVPKGSSRLRFTFSCSHKQGDVHKLVEVVKLLD